jgi:hypothetical protein
MTISGKMILITSEERKKVAQRNFAFETFIFSLLDSLYRPSIIFNILYILINSKSKFFKNKGGKIKGTLENGDFEIEMRHSDYVMPNYMWIITDNKTEIRPKLVERVKIR